MTKQRIALRMDDVFASTKQFEIYGKDTIRILGRLWPLSLISNFLWLKYCPGLRKRLPYRELRAGEWEQIIKMLLSYNAKLTVGVTAVWVEWSGELIPFFKKFPEQAAVLKNGVEQGVLEIANHGLTHCVAGRHRPRPFASNRLFHREFWDWIPAETHRDHLRTSQRYLKEYFGCDAVTFIPPGNVWTPDTERFARESGLRYLASTEALSPTGKESNGMRYAGDSEVFLFHDWDIVRQGLGWFKALLESYSGRDIVFIKDLLPAGCASSSGLPGLRAEEKSF
ncbi:MAG: polysaccharide deacetylase family protein, partial [Candidatus Omnitrophota bacterium]